MYIMPLVLRSIDNFSIFFVIQKIIVNEKFNVFTNYINIIIFVLVFFYKKKIYDFTDIYHYKYDAIAI